MRPSPAPRRLPRLDTESGFTLIEVMVAMVVLIVGILGTVGAFDGARKLTLLSERRTEMAHRAQLQLERLQQEPYSELAMGTTPAHSSESASINPDYYVNTSPTTCTSEGDGCYAWNSEATSEEETLIPASELCTSTPKAGCGVISASPSKRECSLTTLGACEWKRDSSAAASTTSPAGTRTKPAAANVRRPTSGSPSW